MAEAGEPFALGDWLVEPSLNRISVGTQSHHLRPQVMDVLVYLAGRDGKVATLESIHDDLWAGRIVSTGTIYNCIAELRHAFASSSSGLEYIETLPKKGYRLTPQILTRSADSGADRMPVSIAILPLINGAAMDAIDYLCDGIADEVLHRLLSVDGLRVYSARALKGEQLDSRVIGLRYGAALVLSGSLQMRGRQLRTIFLLEKVADGQVAWCGRFEHDMDDLFALQETVARQLVDAVVPMLSGTPASSAPLEASGTRNLEALKAFLLGRYALSQMTFSGQCEAIRCFERAVQLDPSFARAHYRLYLACYMKCRIFGADETIMAKARNAACKARDSGYRPAVPWVHIHRRLHPEARLDSRQLAFEAIEKIRSNDNEWGSFAGEQLTWVLADAGLFDAALVFARKVLASADHNFEDSDIDEEIPRYAAACGSLDEAIGLWSRLIQKDPGSPLYRFERCVLYARTGLCHYARADLEALNHLAFAAISRAFLAFYQGNLEELRSHHEELLAVRAVHPSLALCTCFLAADFDRGMDYYEQAVNEKARTFVDFGVTRVMTRARLPESLVVEIENQPRFRRLMASQGIDEKWRHELVERLNEISDTTGIVIGASEAKGAEYAVAQVRSVR